MDLNFTFLPGNTFESNNWPKGSRILTKKSLESNIVDLNRFCDFGEAKITDGGIPWPAAPLQQITIFSSPRSVLLNSFHKIKSMTTWLTYKKLKNKAKLIFLV